NGKPAIASEVLLKFRTPTPAAISSLQTLLDADSARQVGGATGPYVFHSRSKDVTQLVTLLASHGELVYIEPNYVMHTSAVPNDPSFSALYGLHNTLTPGADISAEQAWDVSTGSTANVIGVIDTGMDYTHQDLAGNVWSAPTSFTVNLSFG